jgi:hypothetical protein
MWKQSALFVLAGLGLVAQTDKYFTIGGTPVQIGQDEQSTLTALRQRYDVHNTGSGTWIVAQKDAPGLQKIGVVSFQEGRLVTAGANWHESYDPNAVQFAKHLVAAVGNQQLSGPRTVVLRPIQTNNENANSRGFEMLIGNRTIQVITSASTQNGKPNAEYATVMESLHDTAFATSLTQSAAK